MSHKVTSVQRTRRPNGGGSADREVGLRALAVVQVQGAKEGLDRAMEAGREKEVRSRELYVK